MIDIILYGTFFVMGWLAHTLLIVRGIYKARRAMEEDAADTSRDETREASIEKIDSVYYAFNNADSSFMGQNTNLEELVFQILGKDDRIRLIVKDDNLKQEVIDLLSQAKTDIVPSSSQEHLGKRQS